MITRDNWPEDWSRVPEVTEIAEEVYDHFLNVLPPLCWNGSYFQCSEPYTHENGKPMYMTFGKKDGRCYYLGIQFYGQKPEQTTQKGCLVANGLPIAYWCYNCDWDVSENDAFCPNCKKKFISP